MLRILFLLLILTSSVVFSQTTENKDRKETNKAYIFAEIGEANNRQVKKLFDEYDSVLIEEFDKGLSIRGYIISYGTDKDVARREKQIQDSNTFRRYHSYRLTFVRGGIRGKLKSVFWIIPEGAELPEP